MQRHVDPFAYSNNGKQLQERLGRSTATTSGRKRSIDAFLPNNNMIDFICKRRQTLAWHQPAVFATSLDCKMQIGVLMQLLASQKSKEAMIEMILQFMSADFSNEGLQLYCLRTLTESLSCTDKAINDAVVTAMNSNPQSLQIQIEGCTAVRRYVKSSGSLNSSGFSAVLQAVRNHADLYLQYLAIDCIRIACRHAGSRVSLAEEAGSVQTILRALETNIHDSRLQELGLSLLSYLVEQVSCRKLIFSEGGVNSIIHAMRNHPSNALIQCNGAAAMCWLVHLEHESAKAALLSNPFAIPTILDISKLYVSYASVFGNCVCILCGIRVGDTSVLESYPELGTATRHMVQVGMRKNPEALKVQRNSMMMLRLVTELEDSTAIPDDLMKESYEDCIEVISASMKSFPDEIDIQSQGCRALSNLAMNSAVRPMLLSMEGCVNQVTSALMRHKDELSVQQGACWFLHGVMLESVGDEGTAAFRGGIGVLEIMLKGLGVDHGPTEED